jgi:hypothetical protein
MHSAGSMYNVESWVHSKHCPPCCESLISILICSGPNEGSMVRDDYDFLSFYEWLEFDKSHF